LLTCARRQKDVIRLLAGVKIASHGTQHLQVGVALHLVGPQKTVVVDLMAVDLVRCAVQGDRILAVASSAKSHTSSVVNSRNDGTTIAPDAAIVNQSGPERPFSGKRNQVQRTWQVRCTRETVTLEA
jgi:hypothetical protein